MAGELFSVKGEGFKEFDRMLDKLPENVAKRVLQKAVTKSLRTALKVIKVAAPRHKGERSPASKEFKTLKQNLRVVKIRRTKRGQKGAMITTGNAFWGFIAEMGSRNQPARPWFLPAFRGVQDLILSTLGVELGKGIEDEAKKLAKGGR